MIHIITKISNQLGRFRLRLLVPMPLLSPACEGLGDFGGTFANAFGGISQMITD